MSKGKNESLFNSTITQIHSQAFVFLVFFFVEKRPQHFVISFGGMKWSKTEKKQRRWRERKKWSVDKLWWRRLDLTDKYKKYNYVNDFQLGISRLYNCVLVFDVYGMREHNCEYLFVFFFEWVMGCVIASACIVSTNPSCNLPLYQFQWNTKSVSAIHLFLV